MSYPYIYWKLPGSKEQEGLIAAREAKSIGAAIYIAGRVLKYKVYHHDNWGHSRFPWHLAENHPMGTRGAEDHYETIDEFASMREAVAEAKRRALKGDGARLLVVR